MRIVTAGANALASDLNSIGQLVVLFNSYTNDNSRSIFTTAFVLLNTSNAIACRDYTTTTTLNFFARPNRSFPFPQYTTSTSTGLTAFDLILRVEIGGTEFLLTAATGATDIYLLTATGASETLMTVSGTTIASGVRRWGFEQSSGYLYLVDDASLAGTVVKRFSLSGTTMTYVDTITLSVAPSSGDKTTMLITDTYIFMCDDSTDNNEKYHVYNKSTGVEVEHLAFGSRGEWRGVFTPDPSDTRWAWGSASILEQNSSTEPMIALFNFTYEIPLP